MSNPSNVFNPGVRRREVLAWAMYDFANSGYTTVVLTAVFNAFFVAVIAQRADWATLAWTGALALSNFAVMLTMPVLGAWADVHAGKRRLLRAATVGCVLSTAMLARLGVGDVALAMVWLAVSNYFFSVGEAMSGAFLPDLARPEALGKVSGWGWSLGYVGGMLTLGLALAWVLAGQQRGESAAQLVPPTMLIVAGVFALAAVPTFIWLREHPQRWVESGAEQPSAAWHRVAQTLTHARSLPDFWRLLVCGAAYQAGIAVVITLAAVYAEAVMGMTQAAIMTLVFVVNIAAALGAWLFGTVQDHIGHKKGLALTLLGWLGMIALVAISQDVVWFWCAAGLAGLCMGSSQSCGRAMVGYLSPASHRAEFFGLWALATRLAAIIGPLLYGLVTWVTAGNHRLAMMITGLFFVWGLWTLRHLDMARGRAASLLNHPSVAANSGDSIPL